MADNILRPDDAASVPGGITAADATTTAPTAGAVDGDSVPNNSDAPHAGVAAGDTGSNAPTPGLGNAGQGQHAAISDLDTDKSDDDAFRQLG